MAAFDRLLPEIYLSIFSHLSIVTEKPSTAPHDLLSLALVSRNLHNITESFSYHLLKKLQHRFPPTSPLATSQIQEHSYRGTYIKHARNHCFSCDSPSIDRMNCSKLTELACCGQCSLFHWPQNISIYEASLVYLLDEPSLRRLINSSKRSARTQGGIAAVALDERTVQQQALEMHAIVASLDSVSSADKEVMAEKFTKRVEWAFEAEKLLDEDQRLWVGRLAIISALR